MERHREERRADYTVSAMHVVGTLAARAVFESAARTQRGGSPPEED